MVHLRATGRAHSKGEQVVAVPDAGVMFTGDHRGASILSQVHVETLRHVLPSRGAGIPCVSC